MIASRPAPRVGLRAPAGYVAAVVALAAAGLVADRYTATTGLPGTVFTALWWGRIAVDRNAYSTFLSVDNGTSTQVLAVQTGTDGVNPLLWMQPSGAGDLEESPAVTMTVGSWYRMAIVRNGTAITYYAGPATVPTLPLLAHCLASASVTRHRHPPTAFRAPGNA